MRKPDSFGCEPSLADESDQPLDPQEEREAVGENGMRYLHLPMATGAEVEDGIDGVRAAIRDLPIPVLIHCGVSRGRAEKMARAVQWDLAEATGVRGDGE